MDARARLPAGATAFERSQVLDSPLVFNEQWGEAGFLGDYFGAVASGDTVLAAYGFATGSRIAGADVHVAFRRSP